MKQALTNAAKQPVTVIGTIILATAILTMIYCLTIGHNGNWVASFGATK